MVHLSVIGSPAASLGPILQAVGSALPLRSKSGLGQLRYQPGEVGTVVAFRRAITSLEVKS